MKNINIKLTPVHCAKLVALILTVFWVLTFNQRIQVLGEAGVEIKFTDMTMVKYLLGLSHSAEEMKMLVNLRDWASS